MTYVKKITAALAAALFAAGCTSAPPLPPDPANEETQAVQRLGRELPKSNVQAAQPAKVKKKYEWKRHSVEKRKRLTDTGKPVLLDGGGGDDSVFFWRDSGERRSEKLNKEQRNRFSE